MRNGPGRFFSPGAAAIQEILLVVALVLAFALAMFVASAFGVAAEGAIVCAHDGAIVVVVIAL